MNWRSWNWLWHHLRSSQNQLQYIVWCICCCDISFNILIAIIYFYYRVIMIIQSRVTVINVTLMHHTRSQSSAEWWSLMRYAVHFRINSIVTDTVW
jgi:hypothetical protein